MKIFRAATTTVVALFLWLGLTAAFLNPAALAQTFPVRVIAGVDIVDLRQGRYAVHEFLDLHNDDYRYPVQVQKVTANTWVGHKKDEIGHFWQDREEFPLVLPGKVRRIAERERVVQGRPRMNWWVRWIQFEVVTDRGSYVSNFIASPLERGSFPISQKKAPQVEDWGQPHHPWKLPDPHVSGP